MHTLIVCGTPWCELDAIHAQLLAAGLANPLPAASGSVRTISDWHQRLFAHRPPPTQPVHPGKAWEQAAGEIFLANWDQPLWGWADARSTWLLDFWLQFDPQVRFVLVHTPAADALVAAAQQTDVADFDANRVLDVWCAHQAQMLQFGLRHRDRCVWFPHVQTHDIVGQHTPVGIQAESSATTMHALADEATQALAEQVEQVTQAAQALLRADVPASTAAVAASVATSLALQWGVPIELPLARPARPAVADPTFTLLQTLAAQAVQQHAQAGALQQEIWASIPAMAIPTAAPVMLPGKQPAAQLLGQVRQVAVVQASAMRRQLADHTQALAQERAQQAAEVQSYVQALDDLQQQLQQAQTATSALQAQLEAEAQATALARAQAKQAQQAQQSLQAELSQKDQAYTQVQEEAELLLLQLHQVQEELEKTFLEGADLRQQLQTDQATRHNLQEQLQHEAQAKAQLQTRVDELQHQLATLPKGKKVAAEQLEAEAQARLQAENQRDALARAKDELQHQLHQQTQARQATEAQLVQTQQAQHDLQIRLTQAEQGNQQLQHQLQAESAAKAQAQQHSDALAQAQAELQQQLQHAQQTSQLLQANLDQKTKAHADTEQEAELLLLQLHQVQEELEHYFLQHQAAQQTAQQLQQRLTRWAQRYPDHCEWDSLAVLPHTKPHWQEVLISQLQQGGRTLPQLHLQLHHTKKRTQLVLRPAADGTLPLLRWPTHTPEGGSSQSLAELILDPAAKPGSPEFAALAALAPSDLQLLQAICKAVAQHLQVHPATSGADAPAWPAHWQSVADGLAHLPLTWRFDTLKLRHEQVNPDYEHLWLHFDHAQYGSRHWPEFEFRLSANSVRKGKWSHLPKLEFPLPDHNGPKQFDNWYEEAEDDKGPKFELRFDSKTPALDINCWNALSPADKDQALALIQSLPNLLNQLEQAQTRIHRPWADWHTLATGIQHALATCLGLGVEPQS